MASRVQEINELLTPRAWRYCPTADNPADLLTRGINVASLDSSVLWKHGPAWLTTIDQWPVWSHTEILHIHSQEDIVDSETQENATGIEQNRETAGLHCIITISNHSSLDKLLGVTAYVLRFIRNTKQSTSKSTGPLSVQELHKAKLVWIRNYQQQVFSKEHHNITSKGSNRLLLVRQLRLFLDNSQFIRCGGRIHNAPVSELMKFLYFLPKNHPFTTLIIRDCHIEQGHAGTNSTITAICQTYWIPALRQYVRKVIQQCVICRKCSGTPYKIPDPPPLPKSRVQQSQPFTTTGVDFTGALYVRGNGREMKVYICMVASSGLFSLISQVFLTYFFIISQKISHYPTISQLFPIYFTVISHFSLISQLFLISRPMLLVSQLHFSTISQLLLDYFPVKVRIFPLYITG